MVIHLQTYNGNNTLNNAVIIDFQTKEVKFTPYTKINHKETNNPTYIYDVITSIMLRIMPIGITLTTFYYATNHKINDIVYYLMWIIIGYFLSLYGLALISQIIFWIPKMKYNVQPKALKGLYQLRNILYNQEYSIKGKYNTNKINAGIKILDFKNIYFNYKLEGEAQEAIKQIKIEPQTDIDNGHWTAEITMKHKINQGIIYLDYL